MNDHPSFLYRLGVLATVAALAVTACSSDGDAALPASDPVVDQSGAPSTPETSAPTTTQPATNVAPTTAAPTTVEPFVDAVELGDIGGPDNQDGDLLAPGRYTTPLLEPFAFETSEDVQTVYVRSDSVELKDPAWPTDERTATIALIPLRGIVLPELAADQVVRNTDAGPADPSADQFLPTPINFEEWIDQVATVSATDSGTIEAPATTVRWWDVVVDPEAGPTLRCAGNTTDCVSAFVSSPTGWGVQPLQYPNLQRIYLFDDQPGVIGLVIAQDVGYFDRGAEIMEMVVATLSPMG